MMPANRILTAAWAGWAGWAGWARWAGWAGWAEQEIPPCLSRLHSSSLGRFDELVDRFRIVERFADREPHAHPPIELAALEQLFVPAFRHDAAAVENEDAIGVPDRGPPMRDNDSHEARFEPA